AEAGDLLPTDLGSHRHSKSWPIDMSNPDIHIATYYGDNNYVNPRESKDHFGIDIQAPVGTDIHPVEDGIIIKIQGDERERLEHMVNITIYSPESNLLWHYVHVDIASLSPRLRKFMKTYVDPDYHPEDRAKKLSYEFDFDSGIKVTPKDVIGKVGRWQLNADRPELENYVKVPRDVFAKYQRSFNHLHLETKYVVGAQPNLNKRTAKEMPCINPTLLLKQLYSFDSTRWIKGTKCSVRKIKTGTTVRKWINSLKVGEIVLVTGDFSNQEFGLRTYDVNEALKKSPSMRRVQGGGYVWIKEEGSRFSNLEHIMTVLKGLEKWELDPTQSPGTRVELSEIMTFSSLNNPAYFMELVKTYVNSHSDRDLFRILLLLDRTDNYEEVLRRQTYYNGSEIKRAFMTAHRKLPSNKSRNGL
ncbi:MAG: hypothetical protein AAB116_26825, partial [Candidatus Poribacteria bacterium]